MSARYAVYFTPPHASDWWAFGAQWLGRDEFDNLPLQQPAVDEISANHLEHLTRTPRGYGFHATLKAPFHLAAGIDEATLKSRIATLATLLRPLPLGSLSAETLGNFVALVPAVLTAGLQDLAAACVTNLDDLRAPLSATDVARRETAALDERGMELLARFGYPYVLERFRLHFTLSGPVEAHTAALIMRAVAPRVERLNAHSPLTLDRLCLFREADRGVPFQRVADFTLGMHA